MKTAKNIMIQGTMSNAGKSLIAAALCRIFRQDGFKAAPFKSQNMALNSFITRDGFEMGRAQVVQAESAGIEPDVRMNPILLKPTTDVGSQVIVNGKAMANMSAMEYYKHKKKLVPYIMDAYNSLAAEYDIIVIEGAGSPVEINLKDEDIVNMGLARMVNSPVLLVGDIDRGGVFAQLYGTVALLEPEERQLLKGLIINKFRGDVEILRPGLKQMEDLCKVPVTGVVPYLRVDIDDEDSLSQRLETTEEVKALDIAVIRLPRISNFTDFSAFEGYDEVSLRYVGSAAELKDPDMIILPGTKSTMADLEWLRRTGLEAAIQRKVREDVPVFGICGGFQMLGSSIADPYRTEVSEDAADHMPGMGLLDMNTVFVKEKRQARVEGIISGVEGMFCGLNGLKYEGYEIHMGQSLIEGQDKSALEKSPVLCRKNIFGTYVHGIFDAPGIVKEILKALSAKKGKNLNIEGFKDLKAYKESQYDLLADAVRNGLDMKYIYSILSE